MVVAFIAGAFVFGSGILLGAALMKAATNISLDKE